MLLFNARNKSVAFWFFLLLLFVSFKKISSTEELVFRCLVGKEKFLDLKFSKGQYNLQSVLVWSVFSLNQDCLCHKLFTICLLSSTFVSYQTTSGWRSSNTDILNRLFFSYVGTIRYFWYTAPYQLHSWEVSGVLWAGRMCQLSFIFVL